MPSCDVTLGTGEAVVVFFCPRRPGGRDGTAAHCMVMAGRISFGSITLWSLAESQESPSVAALRARTRRTRTRWRAEPPPPPTYYLAYTLHAMVSSKKTLYKTAVGGTKTYIPTKVTRAYMLRYSGLPTYLCFRQENHINTYIDVILLPKSCVIHYNYLVLQNLLLSLILPSFKFMLCRYVSINHFTSNNLIISLLKLLICTFCY